MNKEKKLMLNTVIYMIGNFSSKFLTFLLIPFYTFYLSEADYGYADIVSTMVAFFLPIISFQLTDGTYRFLIKTDDQVEREKVISSGFSIVLRNLVIANIAYVILNLLVDINFKYIIFIQFNVAIINAYILQCSRGLKKNQVYAIGGVISTFLMLGCNILFIVGFKMKAEGLLLANIISHLFACIYVAYKIKFSSYFKTKKSDDEMKNELKKYSIPLIPNYLNWWIMNVSDRLLINIFLGLDFNGLYAVANKFPNIINMVCSMFNMAWQESAITEYDNKQRDKFYSNIFEKYSNVLFTTVIILLASTGLLFDIMINEKFSNAYYVVPFLYLGVIFSTFSSFYGTGYQSSKDTKGAFRSSIFGSIVNFVINLLLIKELGLMAAGVSTMLSFIVMWIYRVIDTKKYFSIKINYKKFSCLIVITGIYIFLYYLETNLIVRAISILISLGIFVIVNKELVIPMIQKILRKTVKRR